ncbi:hypothetical protein [Actinacidiphila yeochonensis]|uniref:hypothetical protein n=1 Tax=Actinacidiphila yeochonensis TaxID=89050 RepID=UPI000565CF69|nr:hypothetical protein [Actinacidiphila yeochonensis]
MEPDHVLLRDFGGHAVLLPGGPVHDGQTPMEAAQETLQGPGSGHMILRPALTDQRQLARRKVIVHTFVTLPITRGRADELNPRDGRSSPLIVPAGKRWACSPSAWA